MSVHYKFKSALEYDTVTFDGLHISVKDLKKAIIHQKRIGKNTDFDLQVTNAQTKEVYTDESALIPKNTSLVIARIPLAAQTKGKPWEGYGAQSGTQSTAGTMRTDDGVLSKAVDLTQLDASEDDKIRAMMTQSTLDYDPSNYMKIRGSNQVGVVPAHYRCFKCHQPGHWIKDCPLGHGQEPMEIKKSTGIPRSFMVPVEGPMVPGAMMTPTGQYAVPVLDHQAYNESHKAAIPAKEEKPEIPEDLVCSICKDLLTDAVMIPCCGNSFCDECIRTVLLESEDHECPDCKEKDISPGTLIPNRFLRNSVSNFKNETGYHKRQQYRNAVVQQNQPAPVQDSDTMEIKPKQDESVVHLAEGTTIEVRSDTPVISDVKAEIKCDEDMDSKPIITETDSTEIRSVPVKDEPMEVQPVVSPAIEGPPGVETPPLTEEKIVIGPGDAPPGVDSPPSKILLIKQGQAITSVGSAVNHHRVSNHMSQSNTASRSTPNSEHNRHYPPPLLPQYSEQPSRPLEERPGTPTVDEPGMGPPGYNGSDTVNYADTPPPGLLPTATTLPPSQHMHPPPQIPGPPPPSQPGLTPSPGTYVVPPVATHQPPPGIYPPTNGPPPAGYRMPPPGHPDFNRVGTNTGYGDGAHSLSRVLLVSNLDPSVPPPTVPPPQGPFGARPLYDPTRPPVQYDPHRPPVHGAPPPGYPPYPPGPRPGGRPYPPPRHMQPPPPGMNHRSAPLNISMVIDDPLEAFNRMLREKDERDRRARQQRRVTRSPSYSRSRSSSRSFSRSPRSRSRTPLPRSRHRSRTRSPPPRNRRTPRSRTRSFTISRSRSFSRSPSLRGTPARDYSPRRRPPSRYRSPVNSRNSPPRYRYKERERDRGVTSDRDRERDRDRDRDRAPERERERDRDRDRDRDRSDRDRTDRERTDRDRDYQYYDNTTPAPPPVEYEYDSNYERNRQRPPLLRNPRYGVPPVPRKDYPLPEPYYPPAELCPTPAYPAHTTRYNNRGPPYPPPLMSVKTVPPHGILERPDVATHRKYDDVAPPGIEQPPVPGFENQRYESRCPPYDRPRDDGPPGVDRYHKTSSPYSDREEHRDVDRPPRPEINHRDYRDNRDKIKNDTPDKEDRFERKYSPSPDRRHKSPSPRRSPRDGVSSQDKSRRRKRDDSADRDKRVTDSRTDHDKDVKKEKRKDDEDEKSKKNKEKKKKKEKKEAERKKKKEKKEKKEQEKLKKAEEKKAKEAQECKDDDKKDETLVEKLDSKSSANVPSSSKISQTATISQTSLPSNAETSQIEPPGKSDSKKINLYDDILSEGIDNTVVENYGKIEAKKKDKSPSPSGRKSPGIKKDNDEDSEEKDTSFDGLELQANEAELKVEFTEVVKPKTNEVLAPVPEPSKWEIEEDISTTPEKIQTNESKPELRQVFERPGKIVTSEVIKRAENAIFAKAINAIRPIEIKKISVDRAKLYSGEKSSAESVTKEPVKNIQITIPGGGWNLDDIPPPGTEPIKLNKTERSSRTTPPPNRLSVKERLGCKVEELDKLTKDDKPFEKNRSRTLSPLSRRNDDAIRNTGVGERRVEVDDRRRDDRSRHDQKNRDRNDHDKDRKSSYRNDRSKSRDRSGYRDRRTEKKDQRKDDRRDVRRDNRRDDRRDDKRLERSRSRQWNDRRREDRRKDDRRDSKERDRNTREREKKSRDRSSRDKERNTRDRSSRDKNTRDRSSKDHDRNARDRDLSTRDRNTKDKDRNSRDRDREKDKRRSRSSKSKSSRSESGGEREKRKKKTEKKHKKDKEKEKERDKERDKGKKHKKDDESNEDKPEATVDSKVEIKKSDSNESKVTNEKPEKAKVLDDRRKPTLDESNFEPDYDLETESEKEENLKVKSEGSVSKKRERSKSVEKKAVQEVNKKRRTEDLEKRSQRDSSTTESSDSSSDDKHKKKHRKHKKKKSRRDSSSSSSSTDSDSSVDRKSKKRHKSSKRIKKKKKSKHK